jgi:hypothetical protein
MFGHQIPGSGAEYVSGSGPGFTRNVGSGSAKEFLPEPGRDMNPETYLATGRRALATVLSDTALEILAFMSFF